MPMNDNIAIVAIDSLRQILSKTHQFRYGWFGQQFVRQGQDSLSLTKIKIACYLKIV